MRFILIVFILLVFDLQAQFDTSKCLSFTIMVQDQNVIIKDLACPSPNDSLTVLQIHSDNPRPYLLRYQNYHVVDMWLSSERVKELPLEGKVFSAHLKQLWVWYPNVRKSAVNTFVGFDSLKVLQLITKLKVVPNDIFYLKSLEDVYLVLKRRARFSLPVDYVDQIRFLTTNLSMTHKNAFELAKMNLKKISLLDVHKVNEDFKLLVSGSLPQSV
jgi:hypothetical protein